MAQKSGPFDSTKVVEEIDGFPRGDRAITSDELAAVNAAMISDGVAQKVGDAFRVTTDGASGTILTVGSGFCMIRGRYALDGETSKLDVGFSEDDRTLVIAQRLDTTTVETAAIHKTVVASPETAPTETTTVKELWLARVTIPGGTVHIAQSMITDLRGSDVCPWTVSVNAATDYDALPVEIRNGYTRVATSNGGTADAFTAVVPNFDPTQEQYAKIAIRLVPTENSNANATLSVNGGTAYPLYRSDGDPCALYSLRAGVPVDVIFYQNKYFFKSAGSGAEYTKYATGNVECSKNSAAEYAGLTFKPRLLFLAIPSKTASGSTPYYPNGCVCLFDAAGEPLKTIAFSRSTGEAGWWWDSVTGSAAENGFSIQVPQMGSGTATFYAYA